MLVGECVEVWGEGDDRKMLTLGPLQTLKCRVKVNSVNDGLTTELMDFPLSKGNDGNFVGDGYEEADKYGIALVTSCDGNGLLELEFFEISPAPFPKESMVVDWYKDKADSTRFWGISECGGYSFSKTERTNYQLVCFKLKDADKRAKRIADKCSKGFVHNTKSSYEPASRNFNEIL